MQFIVADMWTNFFDITVVINLNKRKDRKDYIAAELGKYNIPHFYWIATENPNGKLGICQTMIYLFEFFLATGKDKILVFEDDAEFLIDPNNVMDKVVQQLPQDFHLLFLGANVFKPFKAKYSENLLLLNEAISCHAVCYSKAAVEIILPRYKEMLQGKSIFRQTDMALNHYVVKLGKSFCTYPLLCTQRSDFSDIEKRKVNYQNLLINRYNQQLCLLSSKT